ncbi:putative HTH-type transcriptional regulator YdfL [Purpureocillium lavendulum]|uniref:EKC/KEOPS complex subunit BUD32 n=1 Tax=Purpureocillium lavendulum TaxID=1247861 RepID=A0AB34FFP6_9HYPO|nr:putative HTH-type transcriptional regulator YdfL [Purpureocillium lavendulum]
MNKVEELERRLREAEERVEEAERERQKERDRAEKEQQRAEEAERERQYERDRAEKEQHRADEAERDRQHERDRAEKEQQRAEEAEIQTRLTTFDEYIAACHRHVSCQFTVERDHRLTSRGSTTSPRDKLLPTSLESWPDFLELQRSVFDTLYGCLPPDNRVFESQNFLIGLGRRVAQRPIADEKTLEYFMHNSVEDPVRAIMDQFRQIDEVRDTFDVGNGIVFENHPHAISDVAEEVDSWDASTPPQTPDHRRDLHKLRPDQICIYRSGSDATPEQRAMIFVSEYKAPHKLTAPYLRAGLRPMSIYKEVVNRKTIPTSVDADGRFQYHAERLTASALTQTYHYMIEGGLEYGLLTTGEATVFLNVDWAKPETLYYHLAEPGPEVLAHPEHVQSSSAVGQYLAFSLMALGGPGQRVQHGQDERDRAMGGLCRWAEDFETTLRSIPENERVTSDSASSWAPMTYEDFDRSPVTDRGRRPRRGRRGGEHKKIATRRDQSESSDDGSGHHPPDTPSPSERRERQRRSDANVPRRSQRILAHRTGRGTNEEVERQYCTQACLLGLVRGGALDPRCPNAEYHGGRRACAGTPHPISHGTWLRLLSDQLRQTLDDGITKLGKHGARGVLFKVTLLLYRYTFVCKGTVQAFIRDLEHEASVYKRLERVQGINVPVFLGSVDLRPLKRTYYYDHRVYIVHMTFLSWGGDTVDEAVDASGSPKTTLEANALASLRAIHKEGVVHRDVRSANMLVNSETNGVMMIDFERAKLVEQARRPLAHLVPNKRRLEWDTTGSEKDKARKRQGMKSRDFAEDNLMARTAFLEMGIC